MIVATRPTRPDGHLTLVLGGARSGKSALAERLVEHHPGPLLYVATASMVASDGTLDADMADRIATHVARRGERYTTVEAGADLVGALAGAPPRPALVDGLGTWVAAHFVKAPIATTGTGTDTDTATATATATGTATGTGTDTDIDALCHALASHPAPVVVVSDEVGMGVHPSHDSGRRFRDALGTVNQAVAAIADVVLLVAAGRAVRLRPFDEIVGAP